MGRENLDNLVRIGKLKVEPPSEREIAGLIRSGRRRNRLYVYDAYLDTLNRGMAVTSTRR